MPKTYYTQEEYDMERRIAEALTTVIDNVDRAIGYSFEDTGNKGHYRLIPFNSHRFIELMERVKKVWQTYCKIKLPHPNQYASFLDVGCGIGTKIQLASNLGFEAKGIENNKNYIKFAKKLCYDNNIIDIDGRNYMFYDKYNIIYFYVPNTKEEFEIEMETKIIKDCREGTILLPVSGDFAYFIRYKRKATDIDLLKENHIHLIDHMIYIKCSDESIVKKLQALFMKDNDKD